MRQLNQNELETIAGGIISPTTVTAVVAAGKAAAKKAEAWVKSGGLQRMITKLGNPDG